MSFDPIARRREIEARRLAPGWWDPQEHSEFLLRAGDALCVSVTRQQVSLWLYTACGEGGQSLLRCEAGPVALRSYERARRALASSLSLLWDRNAVRPRGAIPLVRLATLLAPGATDARARLDGPSVGLAMLLSLASAATGLAMPADLVATADITVTGDVRPVGRVARKLRGLSQLAPGVGRVLVAADEPELEVPPGIRVVRVSSGPEALSVVFGDERIEGAFVSAGAEPARRAQVLRGFLHASMRGRTELVSWTPVRRAAARALSEWPDLGEDERNSLSLSAAVASRLERVAYDGALPEVGWVSALPSAVKGAVLAQLLQQSNDTGRPEPEEVLAWVEDLPDLGSPSPPFLRLRGARARLWATQGLEEARRALVEQEAVARTFLDLMMPSETTFGLSEWYRLAGLLGDVAAFERAEAIHRLVEDLGGLEQGGRPFVELAEARGRVLLGREVERAETALRGVEARVVETMPDVAGRARRWRALALEGLGRAGEASRIREELVDPVQVALARVDVGGASDGLLGLGLVVLDRLVGGPLDAARWYPY